MIEKPPIPDEDIIACLQEEFQLPISGLVFLPLGADMNTAVYRAVAKDGRLYFVKLRHAVFDAISVDVPKFLHDQGIAEIISPLASRSDALWADLQPFKVVVYPFIDGQNGWEVALTETQWALFGRALRQIHAAALPASLAERIPHESYSPRFREQVRQFQAQIERTTYAEPNAAALAQLFTEKKSIVSHIVQRAENLAGVLRSQSDDYVLCHSDIHMGNLLISKDGTLSIVDWDQPILAPKERDLMFIGGGIGGGWVPPEQEEALFYAGYGQTDVNMVALAYYRYERIVEDMVAYCEQLLLSDEGGEDRPNSLRQITGQFLPGDVIDMAYRTEERLPSALQAPEKKSN